MSSVPTELVSSRIPVWLKFLTLQGSFGPMFVSGKSSALTGNVVIALSTGRRGAERCSSTSETPSSSTHFSRSALDSGV